MRPQFYITILQQATDLFMELSPTSVLGLLKKKFSPEGIHHVAELPFPASLPCWSFVPSVAKSCEWHLRDHHSELHSPQPSGMHSLNICDQSHSPPPYVLVSSLVAFFNQLLI